MDVCNDLVTKIKNGDENSFNELLDYCRKLIYKIIYNFVLEKGDYRADIDDLFQEGSLALYQCCFMFDESIGVKFSTFAFSFIRKKISIRYRNTFKSHSSEFYSLDAYNTIDYITHFCVEETPIKYHKEKEFEEYLNKFVRKLSDEDKNILKLRNENYTYKEISQRLKINEKKIDNRLSNMRKKLRTYLQDEDYYSK